MSLVSIAEARALVATGLTDDKLQAVIDREEQDVVEHFGAHYVDATTTVSETLPGSGKNLYLRRKVLSVDSITEDEELLVAEDYRLWGNEGRIERLPRGSTWGDVIDVVYVPQDDTAQRKMILVELVRLALNRTALKSESVAGEYSYTAPDDYEAERTKLLRRLGFPTM